MKRRSLLLCCVLFFTSLSLIVSCTNPASQISTNTGSSAPTNGGMAVRLGYSAWPGWFPWQVAQEQKIFEAKKLAVDLKWFDGYLESINTLTAGQIDANSQTLNDPLPLDGAMPRLNAIPPGCAEGEYLGQSVLE